MTRTPGEPGFFVPSDDDELDDDPASPWHVALIVTGFGGPVLVELVCLLLL